MSPAATLNDARVDRIGAGAAAASGGTLLILIAEQLRDPWRHVVLFAAPPLSVLASLIWGHVQTRIVNRLRDREVDSIIARAREVLTRELDGPGLTVERRQRILANLERLSDVVVARHVQRVEAIAIAPEADIEVIRPVLHKAG